MKEIFIKWQSISLVKRILLALILGVTLATIIPDTAKSLSILGSIFVGLLKSVAPILVFFLVMSAIANQKKIKGASNIKTIIWLYLLSTFLASLLAVSISFMFPVSISLREGTSSISAPSGILEVLKTLILNIVDNPISALFKANYIGILTWSILLGIALKKSSENTKDFITHFSNALTNIVQWIIELAPFGIFGIVCGSIAESGLSALLDYSKLILLLVGSMLMVALIINPLIAFFMMRRNPYPLVFRCLKQSGITAFFTRSSAANIPVNMKLCQDLKLEKDTYSVSIPLGATINMGGAAITISILTLAAVHTLGIEVDFITAIILSILAALSACGASGVAGGSLLLIPLAASLFGIPNDIAIQVVGVGFIIGIIQDSCETALNSSSDVLWTSVAEFSNKKN